MVLFNSHILNWREKSFLCNEIEADIKDNLKYGLKAKIKSLASVVSKAVKWIFKAKPGRGVIMRLWVPKLPHSWEEPISDLSALGLVARGQKQSRKSPAQSMKMHIEEQWWLFSASSWGSGWWLKVEERQVCILAGKMEAHCCDPNYMDINEK